MLEILGKRHDHRTGPAGYGHVDGATDQLGYPCRVIDLDDPLGDATEKCRDVEFLEGTPADVLLSDLADDQEHRDAFLGSTEHADRGVGGTGTARHQAHPGSAGHAAMGLGHEGGSAFMSADHEFDRVVGTA